MLRRLIAAALILAAAALACWILSRPPPVGSTYSTPHGEFPREQTYLE